MRVPYTRVMTKGIEERLKKKYGLKANFSGGNPNGILNDLQNVTAVLLLPVDHPLYKRVRSLAFEQRNNERKKNQEVQKRKREQNNELVPIRVPGGGKCTMITMGRRSNHR